jgi:hypothetical protein
MSHKTERQSAGQMVLAYARGSKRSGISRDPANRPESRPAQQDIREADKYLEVSSYLGGTVSHASGVRTPRALG